MQVLTIDQAGSDWAFRDVTGEIYGRSPDIRHTYQAAQQMARRTGAHLTFSAEAESHFRAATDHSSVDSMESHIANGALGARAFAFLVRFVRRRRLGSAEVRSE